MFKQYIRISLLISVLAFILCGIYPFVITVAGKAFFPTKVNGQILERRGVPVGSALIGQKFSKPHYLIGRPSFAGLGYESDKSGGSNLAIGGQKFYELVQKEVNQLRKFNVVATPALVPIDLVTGSASGLDPHITPEAALFQAPRVAQARKMHLEDVKEIFSHHYEYRILQLFGEESINVLGVNLELDEKYPVK